MTSLYNTAIEALLCVIQAQTQKTPAAGFTLQQALLKIEIALDRASTEAGEPDTISQLLSLRQHLLTAQKYCCYAKPSQ